AIDPSFQYSEYDRLHAIIHRRKRYGVGAAQMQKDSKRADPNATRNALVARAIHIPGPDDDVGEADVLAVLGDYFVLLSFCEGISVAPKLGTLFERARFIEEAPPRFPGVGIDRERTDVDESPKASV